MAFDNIVIVVTVEISGNEDVVSVNVVDSILAVVVGVVVVVDSNVDVLASVDVVTVAVVAVVVYVDVVEVVVEVNEDELVDDVVVVYNKQILSVVKVGAVASYSAAEHKVILIQILSVVAVGAAPWN